jgi:hypothetical protein
MCNNKSEYETTNIKANEVYKIARTALGSSPTRTYRAPRGIQAGCVGAPKETNVCKNINKRQTRQTGRDDTKDSNNDKEANIWSEVPEGVRNQDQTSDRLGHL